jgi:hypothetical protein
MKKITIPTRLLTTLACWLLIVLLQIPANVYAEDGMYHDPMPKSKTVYFPQFQAFQSVKNETYLLYGLAGKLVLSDECLRVASNGSEYLLIWPNWYDFAIAGREIVVTHLHTGLVVARLKTGDTVNLSGAELENNPVGLEYAIPDQCAGPYWAVGDIESVKTEKPIKYYKNHDNKAPAKTPKNYNAPAKKYKMPEKTGKDPNKVNKELRKLEIKIEESILK